MMCISSYLAFKFKTKKRLQVSQAPSSAGEGWDKGNKINYVIPLIPTFTSLKAEGVILE